MISRPFLYYNGLLNGNRKMAYIDSSKVMERLFLLERFFEVVRKNVINGNWQCNIHYPANSRQKRRLRKYEK